MKREVYMKILLYTIILECDIYSLEFFSFFSSLCSLHFVANKGIPIKLKFSHSFSW